jgi:putative CocE/NonD family hydrolase
MKGRYPEVDVPALFITGWYDNLLHEEFKVFDGWRHHARSDETRRTTKLVVGPWTHRGIGSGDPIGDVDFGPEAGIDLLGLHLRWYDRRLRDLENGIDDEPPVRIFVMGANTWRDEREWPLARTHYTPYYLRSGGRANSLFGDGALSTTPPAADGPADSYDYDPADPVPTLGGQSMIESPGPLDRRPVERRDDVLVFSTELLEQDVEVTGPVEVILYAASSAVDTDFAATLVDVHPGGLATNVCEGIRRARFRESLERPSLIEAGRVYEYRIDLWETSNLFKAGHRIRVEVTSSNFPRFDRNLNSGEDLATGTRPVVAHQTILHDAEHPSRIVLPIIPSV